MVERILAVLKIPEECDEVLGCIGRDIIDLRAVPAHTPCAVEVPRREAELLALGDVVVVEVEVLAVIVRGEHQFDKKVVVAEHRQVEVFGHFGIECGAVIALRGDIDSLPEWLPIDVGRVCEVGIFGLPGVPVLAAAVGRRHGYARVTLGVNVVAHKRGVGPSGRLVEHAAHRVAFSSSGGLLYLAQLQLLAVHLLRHTIDAGVFPVEQHLDEAAVRAVDSFLLKFCLVGLGREVEP